MENIFEKVYTEKDLNKLKSFITKEPAIYAEVVKIRDEINYTKNKKYNINNIKLNNWNPKVLVEKIFNIEKKAHELGKTKTPTNSEILILFENRLKENLEKNLTNERIKELRQLLKRLKVRSNSGVAVVSLLTKPYACPGKCIYCPTEVKMPKSYLSKEPAAARALANNFDPYKQMVSRLRALEMNGHPIDKLEIIVIGGTFDYYKKDYQEFFISEIFRAANEYSVPTLTLPEVEVKTQNKNIFNFENIANYGIAPPSGELRFSVRGTELNELQHQNETANCRIIGLSTETRPDYINFENLNWLRYLGVTKIEIGVQHLDNEVLDFNGREMTRESIAKATEILRAAGFKFVYHMMPNLPKSNEEMDIKMFRDLYDTKDFHPDMLKVYPNMILKTTLLYKMFTQKKDFVIAKKLKSIAKKECKTFNEDDIPTFDYQPYDDEKLIRVLAMCEREIKNYTRVIRMIRDIPATYILASSKKSNMRELVDQYQKENGFLQQDIRSREVRDLELDIKDFNLRDTIYETQHGEEHFIEYINEKDSDKIAGFVRLRLQDGYFDKELNNFENLKSLSGKCALIRELHVYGTVKKINEEGSQSQHIGFGKRLMAEAERVAKEKGYKKVAVIAGVGVRKYYEKIGYKLENTYMIKYL